MTLSILRTSPTTQSLGFVTDDQQELIKKLAKKISERSVRLSLTLTLTLAESKHEYPPSSAGARAQGG
jgi:hypothetical protein